MKSNYQSASERIRKSETVDDLHAVEEAIARVYDEGQLTVNEYSRLDRLVVDKSIELES